MIKEIQFKGYSTEPSDYECADGALAESLNLICEDNQLKPVFQPATLMTFDEEHKIVFIHKTSTFTHYIVQNTVDSQLYWVDADASSFSASDSVKIGTYRELNHINAVGNTLIVFTSTAINYILWKSDSYNSLGDQLPEIALSFGLIGHPRLYSLVTESGSSSKRGTFTISFNSIAKDELYNTFSDANKTKITSQVMAKVNKFIAEQTVNKGRFCFPFFVRWAYRLFDGSHVMHSAPVLMTPSTTPAPVVFWNRATGSKSYTEAECDIMMVAADLDFSLMAYNDYAKLENWADIITAVDIYISKPIYTYDQDGEFTSFNDTDNFESTFVGRLYNGEKDMDSPDLLTASTITEDRMLTPINGSDFMLKYYEYTYERIYALYFSIERTVPNTTLHMPEFSDDKSSENIESTCNFYKLASIDIEELVSLVSKTGTRKKIEVEDEYLQSLVNRETLSDDYLTHDRLMASHSYGFNSRLNLAGVKRELFDGFIANAMFPFCEGWLYFSHDSSTNLLTITQSPTSTSSKKICVYIRENGEVYSVAAAFYYYPLLRKFVADESRSFVKILDDGSKIVTTYDFDAGTRTVTEYDSSGNVTNTTTTANCYYPTSWGSWLFYPNANAFKIAVYEDNSLVFVCDLKEHDFLNGAYAFLGFKSERGNSSTVGTLPTVTDSSGIVDVPNKIYTSEVNNPFYFPLMGINTVGDGTILGMSSANKALSQGQFGQFPLYAFTTEGVWALEVSSSGGYSAKQPITRDVCINADGITQLDSAVLFPTDRGIMLIEGSNAVCITDTIFAENPFNVLDLPAIEQLHAKLGHDADACLPVQPFLSFLTDCKMVYDYVHQRVIVFNPTTDNGTQLYTYAYVYSLKSKQWGMMFSNFNSALNSYPDALAMTSDNRLVSFATTTDTECNGLYITRPLKLDAPDVHKTVSTVIQRGHFRRGDVATVLYGSRDLYTWRLIWSSKDRYLRGFRGTPYKYFRIAALANLSDGKSVFGASLAYDLRHTNNLR